MAFWSDIIGGLGAAGGGYARALDTMKARQAETQQHLDEMNWREEESQRRTNEELARVAAAEGARRDTAAWREQQEEGRSAWELADIERQNLRDAATEEHRKAVLGGQTATAMATAANRSQQLALDQQSIDLRREELEAATRVDPSDRIIVEQAFTKNNGEYERTRSYIMEQYQGGSAAQLESLLGALDQVGVERHQLNQASELAEPSDPVQANQWSQLPGGRPPVPYPNLFKTATGGIVGPPYDPTLDPTPAATDADPVATGANLAATGAVPDPSSWEQRGQRMGIPGMGQMTGGQRYGEIMQTVNRRQNELAMQGLQGLGGILGKVFAPANWMLGGGGGGGGGQPTQGPGGALPGGLTPATTAPMAVMPGGEETILEKMRAEEERRRAAGGP